MIIYSEGLYGNIQLKRDIPAGRFKPYSYTEKDFEDTKNKVPVCKITLPSTEFKLSIKDCILKVNNDEINLLGKSLIEVLDWLDDYFSISSDLILPIFELMPALMLSNCNTEMIFQIDGVVSPLDISEHVLPNKTVISDSSEILSVDIFDLLNNQTKTYSKDDESSIFYDVSTGTKVIIKVRDTSFYIFADYDSKISLDGMGVGNLLGLGE